VRLQNLPAFRLYFLPLDSSGGSWKGRHNRRNSAPYGAKE
jgi:hypothetical protein